MSEEKFDLRKLSKQLEDALNRRLGTPTKLTERDVVSPGVRLRCMWTVTAGVIPGHVVADYTKRWCLTSETWDEENAMDETTFMQKFPDLKSTFIKFRDEAHEYAASLTDPRYLNWSKVEWIWM